MKRYTYRAHQIVLDPKRPLPLQLEAAVNAEGCQGWRVISLEVTPRLAIKESSVWVLLERELEDAE